MKYRIMWFGGPKPWTLQYRYHDEGGGGWTTVFRSRFRCLLKGYARKHRRQSDRLLVALNAVEEFEL